MEQKELYDLYAGCDAFVICSTLNQMVNYIPIINMWDAKAASNDSGQKKVSMYTITYERQNKETKERFDNTKWDENLNKILKDDKEKVKENDNENSKKKYRELSFGNNGKLIDEIPIERKIKGDATSIINKIGNHKNIVWNITGGQRNAVLSIFKAVHDLEKRGEDKYKNTIIYLEGNTGKTMVRKPGTCIWDFEETGEIYTAENLSIEKAFGLAGFEKLTVHKSMEIKNDPGDAINKFCDKYYLKDRDLRERLVETLRNQEHPVETVLDDKVEDEKIKNEVKEIAEGHPYQFGYILEQMALRLIRETLANLAEDEKFKENFFVELAHDVRLSEKDRFCQFDIVLLTKHGQVIIFECKSGVMESESAKARNYTVYAASGVYGTPVLITPMTWKDINDKDEIIEKAGKKNITWNRMNDTYNAAERAHMDVWAMDEIGDKIKDLFKDLMR